MPGAVITVISAFGRTDRTTDFNGRCIFDIQRRGVYYVEQRSAPAYLIKSGTVHRAVFSEAAECDVVISVGFANALRYPSGTSRNNRRALNAAAALIVGYNPCRPFPYYTE